MAASTGSGWEAKASHDPPRIIALTGPAGVGKSTTAAHMLAWCRLNGRKAARASFADPLRQAVVAIFGSAYSTQAAKAAVDPYWSQRLGPTWATGRDILQRFGTEICRQHLHEDIWVMALERRIEASGGLDFVIIDDCRFHNEARWVRQHNGVVVRLRRPGIRYRGGHASERAIDRCLIDCSLDLDGDRAAERLITLAAQHVPF